MGLGHSLQQFSVLKAVYMLCNHFWQSSREYIMPEIKNIQGKYLNRGVISLDSSKLKQKLSMERCIKKDTGITIFIMTIVKMSWVSFMNLNSQFVFQYTESEFQGWKPYLCSKKHLVNSCLVIHHFVWYQFLEYIVQNKVYEY